MFLSCRENLSQKMLFWNHGINIQNCYLNLSVLFSHHKNDLPQLISESYHREGHFCLVCQQVHFRIVSCSGIPQLPSETVGLLPVFASAILLSDVMPHIWFSASLIFPLSTISSNSSNVSWLFVLQ